MKELKKDQMDPEQYWPEAEKLLEKHYTVKRRRRAVVWLGVVIVALVSVFLVNSRKENITEVIAPAKIEKGDNVSTVNRNNATHKPETTLPSKEEKINSNDAEVQIETHSPILPNDKIVERTNSNSPVLPYKVKQNNSNANANANDQILSTEINSSSVTQKSSEQGNAIPVSQNSIVEAQEINSQTQELSSTKAELNFSDMDFIAALPLLKWKDKEIEEASIRTENRPTLGTKKKTKWDLLVYGGVNGVQKELTGKSNSSYLLRREKEELPTVLPFGGLQLSTSIRNWDFRGGFEFSVIGEQVKYSPYSNGEYYNQQEVWQSNNYIITDTDSAYIWGILFLNTSNHLILDSVKVTVTDTLNGTHYNTNIRKANGVKPLVCDGVAFRSVVSSSIKALGNRCRCWYSSWISCAIVRLLFERRRKWICLH
ncbi:MAG: hypothetical protein IPO63_06990 [Bacteroidetes bacterium]|nr:hypothetical protein [Bacteroidota bacterium]